MLVLNDFAIEPRWQIIKNESLKWASRPSKQVLEFLKTATGLGIPEHCQGLETLCIWTFYVLCFLRYEPDKMLHNQLIICINQD